MKVKIKDLLDEQSNSILSDLFMITLSVSECKEIFDKYKDWQKKDYDIDMELIIDGISVDVSKFFEYMISEYKKSIITYAQNIIAGRLMEVSLRFEDFLDEEYKLQQTFIQENNININENS